MRPLPTINICMYNIFLCNVFVACVTRLYFATIWHRCNKKYLKNTVYYSVDWNVENVSFFLWLNPNLSFFN